MDSNYLLEHASQFTIYEDVKRRNVIIVERRTQPNGSYKWAISNRFKEIFNKFLEWEWEPQPSSRDDEFYTRARYDTLEEALKMATIAKLMM